MENLDTETKKDAVTIIRDLPEMVVTTMTRLQMLALVPMILREEFKKQDPEAFAKAVASLKSAPGEMRAHAAMLERTLVMSEQ